MTTPFSTHYLLKLLNQAYNQPTWHGPNLAEALEEVGFEQALWRPASDAHNIWELVLHCAFWKHVVIRRLEGFNNEEGFSRQPNDFPVLPEAAMSAWQNDLKLLEDTHQKLLDDVVAFSEARLGEPIDVDNPRTFNELIFGVANHDIYHAGQIQLLKRLYKETQPG